MALQGNLNDWMAIEQPRISVPPPGPNADVLIAREDRVAASCHGRGYPLVVERAYGVWVDDVDGNRFLDCTSGIGVTNVGHCHPQVVKAVQEQAEKFFHFCGADFYYIQQTLLSEKLVSITPVDGGVPFFTNSGAESTEAAMKLARYTTRRPRYMALRASFHGRTFGAMSLTSSKSVQRNRFAPLVPEVTHVPNPNCYRCPYNLSYPSCKVACVDAIDDFLNSVCPHEEVAAFFAEPIQGEGGYIVPPPEYFPKLSALCKKYGILLVIDEVQAGNGRTGKMYAIEHTGIRPDILYTAKGLGSGFPIGAMISKGEITKWPAGAHSNTYGANPMGCMAALKTIELLEQGLMKNAHERGEQLFAGLKKIQAKRNFIGDVRGRGLMVAVEIVKDFDTKEKSPELRNRLVMDCFKNGLLTYYCGDCSLRFIPPLIITERQIDTVLSIFDKATSQI